MWPFSKKDAKGKGPDQDEETGTSSGGSKSPRLRSRRPSGKTTASARIDDGDEMGREMEDITSPAPEVLSESDVEKMFQAPSFDGSSSSSSAAQLLGRPNPWPKRWDRLKRMARKKPGTLLYYTGMTLLCFAVLLLFAYYRGGSLIDINPPHYHGEEEPLDPALVKAGMGHLDDRVERIFVLEPWTEAQKKTLALKRFKTTRQYNEDPVANLPCSEVDDKEIATRRIELKGHRLHGYDHTALSIPELLRAQESLLESMAEEYARLYPGDPLPLLFVAPKMWVTEEARKSLGLPANFNPCVLSMRSQTGLSRHIANPKITNELRKAFNPDRVSLKTTNKTFEWDELDFFQAPAFPPLTMELFLRAEIDSVELTQFVDDHRPTEGEDGYLLQFWVHVIHQDSAMQSMLVPEQG